MDANQWPLANLDDQQHVEASKQQGVVVEEKKGIINYKINRPQKDCPRCKSTNTKFCYYNNYSLTQPRYFCKTCRRYWTQGGTLRKVPVGGGSRKNKRSASISSPSPSPSPSPSLLKNKLPPHQPGNYNYLHQSTYNYQNPNYKIPHDLNLGYDINAAHGEDNRSTVAVDVVNYPILSFGELGKSTSTSHVEIYHPNPNLTSSSSSSCHHLSFVGTTMALNTSSNINTNYCGGGGGVFNPPPLLHPHEYFKLPPPRFNFSVDGGGELVDHDQIGYNSTIQEEEEEEDEDEGEGGGRMMLQETISTTTRLLVDDPYEVERNSKQFTTSTLVDQYEAEEEEEEEEEDKGEEINKSGNYWGGLLGGGSW